MVLRNREFSLIWKRISEKLSRNIWPNYWRKKGSIGGEELISDGPN
jgi:hypothetical protein